jgi:hypothetical protein
MTVTKKVVVAAGGMAVLAVILAKLPIGSSHSTAAEPPSIRGAITQQDRDAAKQVPIADVEISAESDLAPASTASDSLGFFSLTLRPGLHPGQSVVLRLRHPNFQPLDLNAVVGDQTYVARMERIRRDAERQGTNVVIENVSVRYSLENATAVTVGSAVKTFQIVNTGNVPCSGQRLCSPDMKWKAAIGSATLDAGEGKEFRNARVSCIAGPCPFTMIESDGFSQGGRKISVSVRDWSDTTTFLLQADVYRPQITNTVRQSYPVIIGRAMNFTLPAAAEGPSIEAKIDGSAIVFPLGPTPVLSWADCNVRTDQDQARVFWCELKPGYSFP